MGTINLTAVMYHGKYRIAQYGQWDGYPGGQGITALEFVRDAMDVEKFTAALERCRFISDEDYRTLWTEFGITAEQKTVAVEVSDRFHAKYKYFDRDHGAKILLMVQGAPEEIIFLRDSIDFAGDSLFCEWAYVVDLDEGTFEVYQGFNTEPVSSFERFAHALVDDENRDEKYFPVRHVISFPLGRLPTNEDFINHSAFKESEEETEASA
jgi:hypothetical protein